MAVHKTHKPIDLVSNLNLINLDGVPCKKCGKVPSVFKRKKLNDEGVEFEYIDRSSRVDCDSGRRENSCLETYCEECYWKLVRKRY